MRIIVDAFGGDNAPLEVIKGAAMAVAEYGHTVVLVGREEEIRRVAADQGHPPDRYGDCGRARRDKHGGRAQVHPQGT